MNHSSSERRNSDRSLAVDAAIERLIAREGINRAFDNYALGMDLRDLDRFLSAWHDDAVFIQDNPKGEFAGHKGLQAWVESVWAGYATTNHLVGNLAIDLTGPDQASAVGGCVGLLVQSDGSYQPGGAHYFDRYTRRNGVWRISYRKCWVSHLAVLPGAQLAQFPRDIEAEHAALA